MKIKAIVTGVTGMVGEGVLHECLLNPDVEHVLILTRKPSAITHPKVRELVHKDFHNLAAIEDGLKGYNACFFCLGVSSVGMKEAEYFHLTYDLTIHVAETLSRLNPEMTFCYVSGSGTDSTEQGRSMWARVKGKTENKLMQLPFRKAYMFRPGYMHPTKGMKNTLKAYRYISWMYPLMRTFFPGAASTLRELGLAMIKAAGMGYEKQVLEVRDIVSLARR
jgi:uncharacterized protein YbjT (DUF2867 family)